MSITAIIFFPSNIVLFVCLFFQSLSTVVGNANAQQVKDFFQLPLHGNGKRSSVGV